METKAAASALQKRLKIGIIKASLKYCNVGSDTEQQIYFRLISATESTKKKSASQDFNNLPRTTMAFCISMGMEGHGSESPVDLSVSSESTVPKVVGTFISFKI